MNSLDVKAQVKGLNLLAPIVIASATTTNGTGIDISKFEGIAKASLHIGALVGAAQTVDVAIQTSDTVGGTYATVASFPQKVVTTDNGTISDLAVDLRSAKKFIRASVVTGGTVTSCPVSVALHATKTEVLPV